MISKDQAMAELQRRGVNIPPAPPAKQDALEELKRRGIIVPQPAPEPEPETSIGDRVLSVAEPAATIASSIVAEPLAGLAGIAQAVNPFAEEGAGAEAVEATREALTFQPRTEAGQAGMQAVGEVLEPVGKILTAAEKKLGDSMFEVTGSPTLAAAAASLPTAVLETIGLKGGRIAKSTKRVKPSNQAIAKSLKEAAPSSDELHALSSGVYKELDNSGIRLKKSAVNSLGKKIEGVLNEGAFDDVGSPQTFSRLQKIKADAATGDINITRLESHRRRLAEIARGGQGSDVAAAADALDAIEDFQDALKPGQLIGRKIPAKDINKKYKAARNLYARSRKSETIQQAISDAEKSASGFENGLRKEFDKVTRQKGKKKFFTKEELSIMDDLVAGDTSQNFAKLIGTFGFSEGRATNILGGLAGATLGGVAGGPVGAGIVGAVGSGARRVAGKLTGGKADLIRATVAGGKDSKKIVEAYLKTVPRRQRKLGVLAELLSDPQLDLSPLLKESDKLIKEATEIAAGRQVIGEAAGLAAASAAASQEKLKQQQEPLLDNELSRRITDAINKRNQ